MKHAIVQRDVAHLVLPDEVQELPGVDEPAARPGGRAAGGDRDRPAGGRAGPGGRAAAAPPSGRRSSSATAPARTATRSWRFAEHLDAPVISTFKAKGTLPDDHPLGCGVLGRSGIPVASQTVAEADCLLVLGASFSNHTSIPTWVPTIQVDLDRMILGKFHPVEVPLWGDIARTLELLTAAAAAPSTGPTSATTVAQPLGSAGGRRRPVAATSPTRHGRLHPALVFEALGEVVPDDAVIAVDVGNNTYSFGHFFECRGRQDVLMSGYLGSIGFALPAAIGASVAVRRGGGHAGRKVVSISGDGGLGQYLAEVTTAVKYRFPLTHVVLDNGELAKISREQLGAIRPVWETNLVNPDFAAYAEPVRRHRLHASPPPTSCAPPSPPPSRSPTAHPSWPSPPATATSERSITDRS